MIAIILLPVFMAMQGFDLNDTGYHAQNAAHFLDYATETTTSQVFSRLFDYLFYQVFGFMGLSALYLLNVCTILFFRIFCLQNGCKDCAKNGGSFGNFTIRFVCNEFYPHCKLQHQDCLFGRVMRVFPVYRLNEK